MGTGSRNYMYYYIMTAIAYLSISIASFVRVSDNADTCRVECPLLIRTGSSGIDYSACACYAINNDSVTGGIQEFAAYGFPTQAAFEEFDQVQRYNDIQQVVANRGSACYICNSNEPQSSTVFRLCDAYGDCSLEGMFGFRAADPTDECSILTSPTVRLRGTYVSVLYAFAVFYLFMGLCSIFIAVGFYCYADKWDDDFGRLTRAETCMGFVSKNAPFAVRICNIFVLFFLVFSIILTFGYDVCETAADEFGDEIFFEQMRRLVAAVIAVWIIGCMVGTLFHRCVAKDTPFYAPKAPTDHRDPSAYRCCVCVMDNAIGKVGP